jgi:hypothetical protein
MREKFSTYYELRDACYRPGCPVCRLVERRVHSYLDSLFYESVNDPSVRQRLRGALGFCRDHALKVVTMGDPLGIAIIYEDLLRIIVKQDGEGRLPRRSNVCPACSQHQQFEQRYIDTLVEYLDDDEFQPAFEASDGVCLPHLHRLSLRAKEETLPAWVVTLARQRIQQRRRRLSEFLRKQDVRAKNERQSEGEANACEEAIDFLVGTTD